MRDPERIPRILAKFEKIWKQHPDLRIGQMIEIFRHRARDWSDNAFNIEDTKIENVLDYIIEKGWSDELI